jgi:surfeit locus 1 family protein
VQILLDNRSHAGRVGYEVLTMFVVNEANSSGSAGPRVLVNRGWVPASWDRAELPDISIAPMPVTIEGRVDRLPRAAFDLGSPAATDGRPVAVLSFPDFDQIETVFGRPVHRFQLLLNDDLPDGFTRSWAPATDRADRNVAYAVQWFALAALAVSIALGVAINVLRKRSAAA